MSITFFEFRDSVSQHIKLTAKNKDRHFVHIYGEDKANYKRWIIKVIKPSCLAKRKIPTFMDQACRRIGWWLTKNTWIAQEVSMDREPRHSWLLVS